MDSRRLKVALVDLDGQTVPDWVPQTLDQAGIELIIHDCTTRAELLKHAADAEVVWLFGGSRILQDGNLAALPRCRAVLRTGSGTDNVPVDEATRRGIVVANTPAAFSDGVSDHLIALLFAVVRQLAVLDRAVRARQWAKTRDLPFHSVAGRTLGLVGFGHIAQLVARKLSGFKMDVLVYDPYAQAEALAAHGVRATALDELLALADFVSLHCPLTPQTRHLIGERELALMKPAAILLNTSRGPVIDEVALVRALRAGRIAGAGLDVLENEPPGPDNPLFSLDNVVLTPHVAGYSADGLALRWRYSAETVLALARNEPPASWVNQGITGAATLEKATRHP
jgi:D-3-phosphoglycerate dehydrogenase